MKLFLLEEREIIKNVTMTNEINRDFRISLHHTSQHNNSSSRPKILNSIQKSQTIQSNASSLNKNNNTSIEMNNEINDENNNLNNDGVSPEIKKYHLSHSNGEKLGSRTGSSKTTSNGENSDETSESTKRKKENMSRFEKIASILNKILKQYDLPHSIQEESQLSSPSLYVVCLEHLTQKRIHGVVRNPVSDIHHYSNLEAVISHMSKILGFPLSIDVKEVCRGNMNTIESLAGFIDRIRKIVWGTLFRKKTYSSIQNTENKTSSLQKDSTITTQDSNLDSKDKISIEEDSKHIDQIDKIKNINNIDKIDEQSSLKSSSQDIEIQYSRNDSVYINNSYIHLENPLYDEKSNNFNNPVSSNPLYQEYLNRSRNESITGSAIRDIYNVNRFNNTSIHYHEPSILKENSEESFDLGKYLHPYHENQISSSIKEITKETNSNESIEIKSDSESHATTEDDDMPSILKERPLNHPSFMESDTSTQTQLEEDLPRKSKIIKKKKSSLPSNIYPEKSKLIQPQSSTQTTHIDSSSYNSNNPHSSNNYHSNEYFEAPKLSSRPHSSFHFRGSKKEKRDSEHSKRNRPSSTKPSHGAGGSNPSYDGVRSYRDMYQPFIKKIVRSNMGVSTLLELEEMQRRLHSIQRDKKIEVLRRKRWDQEKEEEFKASLYNRRVYEENLMRKIYKEMLKIEKERLCLENALEKEQELLYQSEAKRRLQSTHHYFRDQMDMIKEEISSKDRLASKEAQKWALKRLGKEAKKRNWSKSDVKRLKDAIQEKSKYDAQMTGDALSKRILKQFNID